MRGRIGCPTLNSGERAKIAKKFGVASDSLLLWSCCWLCAACLRRAREIRGSRRICDGFASDVDCFAMIGWWGADPS
jgi:hypothetical protein